MKTTQEKRIDKIIQTLKEKSYNGLVSELCLRNAIKKYAGKNNRTMQRYVSIMIFCGFLSEERLKYRIKEI